MINHCIPLVRFNNCPIITLSADSKDSEPLTLKILLSGVADDNQPLSKFVKADDYRKY